MPVSRNGVPYYTDEQYNVARYESSALEYAKAAGYQLVKKGGFYTMKDHDSFVFAPNGMWFWNSRDMKGGAIEFLTLIEHKSLVEAVLTLSGERVAENQKTEVKTLFPKSNEIIEEKKPFELPPKADNYKRLFAYLCGARGLDKEIVQKLVHDGKIYEGVNRYENPKTHEVSYLHNAVFVGMDEDDIARSGFERGISTFSTYKGEIEGSDKRYPFVLKGYENINTLAIFEASIDAISHATIAKMDNHDYLAMDRIATGGNAPQETYIDYLKKNPHIRNIIICTDNDLGGSKIADKIQVELNSNGFRPEFGYHCERQIPTGHKDFNEYLLTYKAALEEQQVANQKQVLHETQEGNGFFPEAVPEENEM